jgi:hypothetical protein
MASIALVRYSPFPNAPNLSIIFRSVFLSAVFTASTLSLPIYSSPDISIISYASENKSRYVILE